MGSPSLLHYTLKQQNKFINIEQNSRSQTAMKSVWLVSKLSNVSVGSRRELVANCVHTTDATRQLSRVGVGGVYWAVVTFVLFCRVSEILWERRKPLFL